MNITIVMIKVSKFRILPILIIIGAILIVGSCKKDKNNGGSISGLPVLSTTAIFDITGSSARCGGNITSDQGNAIMDRGVCWSIHQNPTLLDNYISSGSGTGNFSANIIGLTANTTYYVRAYATNNNGTAYGNQVFFSTVESGSWLNPNLTYNSIIDHDQNTYATIVIGTQEWMAENLRTTHYANGDPIINVTDTIQWSNLSTGAWVHYNNDVQYENPYGKLYNWFVVEDARNVCPNGWHVPTENDWNLLINFLDPNSGGGDHFPNIAGAKMKSSETLFWSSDNISSTNESGFSALPGGQRLNHSEFVCVNHEAYFWSSSENSSEDSWVRILLSGGGSVLKDVKDKRHALSVRCIKD